MQVGALRTEKADQNKFLRDARNQYKANCRTKDREFQNLEKAYENLEKRSETEKKKLKAQIASRDRQLENNQLESAKKWYKLNSQLVESQERNEILNSKIETLMKK